MYKCSTACFEQNTGERFVRNRIETGVDGKENIKCKHVFSDTVYTGVSGEVLGDGTRRTTRAARV